MPCFLGAPGASSLQGFPQQELVYGNGRNPYFALTIPVLKNRLRNYRFRAVQNRIARWLQVNGFSPDEDQDEYSYFIEKCLPIADDRRRFFEPWVRKARPHVG